MHIERLELKNYTGFEDFSLDFPKGNLTVFIGENGSGKTSILEGIYKLLRDEPIENHTLKALKHINTTNKTVGLTSIIVAIKNLEKNYVNINIKENKTGGYDEFYNDAKNNKINNLSLLLKGITNRRKSFLIYETGANFLIADFTKWYKELAFYDYIMTKKNKSDYSPQKAVEQAIMCFSGIKIDSKIGEKATTDDLIIYFEKNGRELSFSQLSQGEQKMIHIIGKIIDTFVPPLKEDTGDILSFYGIVLIDEIETHLHPRWQREMLPNLTKTFPNVQFIVTTHSPQVISSVPKEAVFLLKDFKAIPVQSFTQGRDSNALLTEVFDVPERPAGAMALLANFYQSINDKKAAAAEKYLQEMRLSWGELDSEVIKATWDFEELLNEREEEIA